MKKRVIVYIFLVLFFLNTSVQFFVSAADNPPVIQNITRTPDIPKGGLPFSISADVTDDNKIVKSVSLKYWIDDEPHNKRFKHKIGDTWQVDIGALPAGANFSYLIEASDGSNTATTTKMYFILYDGVAPTILDTYTSPENPIDSQETTVYAKVTDNVGVESVYLNYRINGDNSTEVEMIKNGDFYTSFIPVQTTGTKIEYTINAYDVQGNPTSSDPVIVYCTDGLHPVIDEPREIAESNIVYNYESFQILAEIFDESGIKKAYVDYWVNDNYKGQKDMILASDYTYSALFEGIPGGYNFSYQIYAEDNNGYSTTSPLMWFVAVDTEIPIIFDVIRLQEYPVNIQSTTIQVNTSDSSGISYCILYWMKDNNESSLTGIMMNKKDNSIWESYIPPQETNSEIKYWVNVTDEAGNTAKSEIHTYIVNDGTKPYVQQHSFLNNCITMNDTITIFANITEDENLTLVNTEIGYLDANNSFMVNNTYSMNFEYKIDNTFTYSVTIPPIGDCAINVYYRFILEDSSANTYTSDIFSFFVIDTVKPVVHSVQVEGDACTSDIIPTDYVYLKINVSDNGELWYLHIVYNEFQGTYVYHDTFDSYNDGLKEGENYVIIPYFVLNNGPGWFNATITAYDKNNNYNTYHFSFYVRDGIKPTYLNLEHSPTKVAQNSLVSLSCSYDDTSSVTGTLILYVNYVEYGTYSMDNNENTRILSCTLNASWAIDSIITYKIYIEDDAGNGIYTIEKGFRIGDGDPPTIFIEDGNYQNVIFSSSNPVNIECKVKDNSNIVTDVNIIYQVNGGEQIIEPMNILYSEDDWDVYGFTFNSLTEGLVISFTINATDINGNFAYSQQITFFTEDTESPLIELISSPSAIHVGKDDNGLYYSYFEIRVTDNVGIQNVYLNYSINSETSETIVSSYYNSDNIYKFRLNGSDLFSLNDLVHIYFTALDASGNIAQTDSFSYFVQDIYGPVYSSIDDFSLKSDFQSQIWIRNVYDWGSGYISNVIVQYQIVSSPNNTITPDWVNITATKNGNDWYANLPLYEATSIINFRLVLIDGYWNERTGEVFTKVVTDGQPPEVVSYIVPSEVTTYEDVEISVTTYDDTAMQNATLIWEGLGSLNISHTMSTTDGKTFNVTISGDSIKPMVLAKIWVELTDTTGNKITYFLDDIYVKDYIQPSITEIVFSNTIDITEQSTIRVYAYDNYKLHEFNLEIISKTYNTTYYYTIPPGDEQNTYDHIFALSPFSNDYNSYVKFIVTVKDLSSYSNDTVSNEYSFYVTDKITPSIDLQKIGWETSLATQGETQVIDFRITDNYQIKIANVTVVKPDLSSIIYTATKINGTLTDGYWRVSFIASLAGQYSFSIEVYDLADNHIKEDNGGDNYVFFVADSTPPSFFSIVIPENYTIDQDNSVTIELGITDNVVNYDLLVYKFRYKLSPSSPWSDWSIWRNVNPSTGIGSFTIPAVGYEKVTEDIQFEIMLSDGGDQGNIKTYTYAFTDTYHYFDILISDTYSPIVYESFFTPYGFKLSGWANENPFTTYETGQNFEKDHDVTVTFALYDNNPITSKGIDLSTVKLHISDGTITDIIDYNTYRINPNPQGWESPVYEFDFIVSYTFSSNMPATIEFFVTCKDQSLNELTSDTYSFIFTDTIAPQITILNGQDSYEPLYTPNEYRTSPYINQVDWLITGNIATIYANLVDNLPVDLLSTTVEFYYYNEFDGPFTHIASSDTSLSYDSIKGCWIATFDTTNYFGRMKYKITVVDQNNNIVELENEFYIVEAEDPTLDANYPTLSNTKLDDNHPISLTVRFSDNFLACPIEYPSIDSIERAKLYITDTTSANPDTDLEIKIYTSYIIWINKPISIEYRFKVYYSSDALNGIGDRWTLSTTPKTLYFYFAIKDEVFKEPIIFADWTNFQFTLEDISNPTINHVKYSSDGGTTWSDIAEDSTIDYYLEDWISNRLKFEISVSDNVMLDGDIGVSVHIESVRFSDITYTEVQVFSDASTYTYTLEWTYDLRAFGADTGSGEYHPISVFITDETGKTTTFNCYIRLVDQTPPSISNLQYDSNPQRGEEQLIQVTVTDHHINELLYDNAYVRFYWGIQPGPYDTNYIDMYYVESGGYWECPFTLDEDDIKFFIKAQDRSGNTIIDNNDNAYYAMGGVDNNPPNIQTVTTSSLSDLEENNIISISVTFIEWGGEPEYVRLFYKADWESAYTYVEMTLDSQDGATFTYSGSFTCKANGMVWYIEIKDYDPTPNIVTVNSGYSVDWSASVTDTLEPHYDALSNLGTIYLSSTETFQVYVSDNGGIDRVELYFDFEDGYGTYYYDQFVGLCTAADIHNDYWVYSITIEDRDDGNLLYIREGGSLCYYFKIYDKAGHQVTTSKSDYHYNLIDSTPFVSVDYSVSSTIYNTNPFSIRVYATLDRIASDQVNLKLEYWHRPYTTTTYTYEGYQTRNNDHDHYFSVNIVSLTTIHDGYVRWKATYSTHSGYTTTKQKYPTSYDTRWIDNVRPIAGSIYASDTTPEVGTTVRIYGYNYYDAASPTNVVRVYWRKKGSTDAWTYTTCSTFGTDDYQGYITAPSYDVEAFIRIYAYQSSNNYKDSSLIYIYPWEDNAPTIGSSWESKDPVSIYESNTIYAYVSDDYGLSSVKIYYRKNYQPTTSTYTGRVTMSLVSGTKYKGTIPGFSSSCTIYWGIWAQDTGGHTVFKKSSSWKYTVSSGFFLLESLLQNDTIKVNKKEQFVNNETENNVNISIECNYNLYYKNSKYYMEINFDTQNFNSPRPNNLYILLKSEYGTTTHILPISKIYGYKISSTMRLSPYHLKDQYYIADLIFIGERFNASITNFFGLEKGFINITNIDQSPPELYSLDIINIDNSVDLLELTIIDDIGIDYVKLYTSTHLTHNDSHWNYLNLNNDGLYWTFIDKVNTKWIKIEIKDVSIIIHLTEIDWFKYHTIETKLGMILGISIPILTFSVLSTVFILNKQLRFNLTKSSKQLFDKLKVIKNE